MSIMLNKSGEKYVCLFIEFNLYNKGVQENNKLLKLGSKKCKECKILKV